MRLARSPLDLGNGVEARLVWTSPDAAIPAAVVLRHGVCAAVIPWAGLAGAYDAHERWTLESLQPLALTEPVRCEDCGLEGLVRDGRWIETTAPAATREA